MADTVVRSAPAPEVVTETPTIDVPRNEIRIEIGPNDLEPIADRNDVVLESLGIQEDTHSIPSEDRANLNIVKDYVVGILKSRELPQTVGSFKTALNNLKGEMGLDPQSEPSVVLDRIAGVVRSWQSLSFIKDSSEKRRLFLSLANLKSSSEMNRKVLEVMDNYRVWN